MKDSLFDLLLDLFEQTITQLKERYPLTPAAEAPVEEVSTAQAPSILGKRTAVQLALIKPRSEGSFRVMTLHEQMRLTKASYQLLERLSACGVISAEAMELIINRLMFSESRFVQLQETKWTIRNTLAATLDAEQLAFLDLVLYQKENGFVLN